jgi:glutamine amidotransferase-like uncharacterized protein
VAQGVSPEFKPQYCQKKKKKKEKKRKLRHKAGQVFLHFPNVVLW